jgi:gamma-glutamyltranspeptidase / glutathione hydrolase
VTRGAVAAGHPAEVDAGLRMLDQGGNAIDAVTAAGFAAFVVEPTNCGLAGYGHLSAYLPGVGRFLTVDHGPRAPRAATPNMFELAGDYEGGHYDWPQVVDRRNELGALAPAVPGAVAGLCAAHAEAGRLPLAQTLEPAIELADAGVEFDWHLLLMILERLDEIRAMPAAAAVLLRDGDPPRGSGYWGGGGRLDTAALAATLRRIARHGAAAFHEGEVAAAVERAVASGGGILTAADLAGYRAKRLWEQPRRYRDLDYVTSNDQVGYEVLNILDRFPLSGTRASSSAFLHLIGEAFGCAFADNVTYYGDPEHTPSPLDGLASAEFAAVRAAGIRPDGVIERPISPADPWPFQPGRGAGQAVPQTGGTTGTTQVVALDESGMAASLITTIGHDFGSLVYVPEVGVFLNSSMVNFDPRPDRPNRIQPGKMPYFAVPAIVAARDGRAVFAVAGSGGYRILSGVVHTFRVSTARATCYSSTTALIQAFRVSSSGSATGWCRRGTAPAMRRLPASARWRMSRVVPRPLPTLPGARRRDIASTADAWAGCDRFGRHGSLRQQWLVMGQQSGPAGSRLIAKPAFGAGSRCCSRLAVSRRSSTAAWASRGSPSRLVVKRARSRARSRSWPSTDWSTATPTPSSTGSAGASSRSPTWPASGGSWTRAARCSSSWSRGCRSAPTSP